MVDRWTSKPISCQGGLILDTDSLLQGTNFPGTARILQNMEPDVAGGYRRIDGYTKYDSTEVPGTSGNPILGVKVGFGAIGGVFACRKNNSTNDNAIYMSNGSGWSTKLNSSTRPGSVNKARFTTYSITTPVIVQTDGVNPAWKWNGTTETIINGTGAPSNPKYAILFGTSLILSGYGTGSLISISVPNSDTNFDGTLGAVEINVGDIVMGFGIFRETLIIFCQRSIKKLSGTSKANFVIQDVTNRVGCISSDTIQEVGGDLIYGSTDGLRSYAGTERLNDIELSLVSKSIQPVIKDILQSSFTEYQYSTCCVRRKSQFRLFVNNPNLPEADCLGVIGKLQDTPITPHGQYEWALMKGIKPYCADSAFYNNNELCVIGAYNSGYVYTLESGNTFDGRSIEAIYKTPDLTFDDATLRKVFQKLDIFSQIEGQLKVVTVQLILDRQIPIIQPLPQPLPNQQAAAQYGAISAVYDTSKYGVFVYPLIKKNLIGSGFFGAFQFVCTDDSGPFRIDSFQVQFSVKGRR